MAFNKRTWLGRQGTGLNKFSIDGATPVTIVNQPDSVTQVGDALSAGNLNDLEDRIEDAFDDVDTELDTKANEQDVTNLNNAINQLDHRLENIEQSKGDYIVSAYKDGSTTPSGKGAWSIVEGLRGVSRVENNPIQNYDFTNGRVGWAGYACTLTVSDNKVTLTATGTGDPELYVSPYPSIAIGHKVLAVAKITAKSSASGEIRFRHPIVKIYEAITVGSLIAFDTSSDSQFGLQFRYMSAGDTVTIDFAFCTDLSVYFAGDPSVNVSSLTIADIQRDYPHLLLPTEYGTRVIDWTGNGVRAWARNLLDPAKLDALSSVTRSGDTWTATIPNWINVTRVEGWAGVSFKAGQQYYVSAKLACASDITNARIQINYTDGTSSTTPFVQGGTTAVTGGLSTAGKTVANILFNYSSGTGNMTVSEFIINQSDSQDGTYTPYHAPNTLSFPSISLKSAGSVREKKLLNVEVEIDGQKVQKSVKTNPLGSYTFTGQESAYTSTTYGRVYLSYSGLASIIKIPGSRGEKANILCAGWTTIDDDHLESNSMQISVGTSGIIGFCLTKTDDRGSVADLKTYLQNHPTTIYFELATPDPDTYSDPILDNTLLTEAYGRMSTVQTGTVVDGISDLGFITL